MKKILAWVCAIAGIALLGCSAYLPAMLKVWQWNRAHLWQKTAWYGKYYSSWGDLVNMSMLDGIKKYREPKGYKFVKPADDGKKNIVLYLFGDSSTEDVPGFAFANTLAYYYGSNKTGYAYSLDPAKKNVLILEVTERYVLPLYHSTEIFDILRKKDDRPIRVVHDNDGKKNYSQVINKNLEYLLFDYNFINAARRGKADMNYELFDRASGDVTVSNNDRYLFFRPTILPAGIYSSYAPVNDTTIAVVVARLNEIRDHYINEGFSEVYFSIVPNPVTILQPDGYNNLIPRIKNNPALKVPYLDVYDTFKRCPTPGMLYRVGDTHWNNNGMQIWLDVVNTQLRKKSQEYQ